MTEPTANGARRTKARATDSAGADATSRGDSSTVLQSKLNQGLVGLRAEFREVVANYSVSVQGLMAQASDTLAESSSGGDAAEEKRRVRVLRELLVELDQINLKPNRGRRKDLKRVEKFVARLADAVADW